MQKHLHCSLMRLIKHCWCKHDQIYKTVRVQQHLGAAIDGESGSHHPSPGRRAQLVSQPSPHSYAAAGMSALLGCSQSCKGQGLLERCHPALLAWCRQGKQQRMVGGRKALPWPCLPSSVPDTEGEKLLTDWLLHQISVLQLVSAPVLPELCPPRHSELLKLCVPQFFTLWLFCHSFPFSCNMLPVQWDSWAHSSA